MATTIRSLARESWTQDQEAVEREESLGRVIVALKGQVNNLYDKVEELRQGTSTAVLFQRLEPARMSTWTTKLTPQDREIIAGEVASLFNLGSFAKAADLKVVTLTTMCLPLSLKQYARERGGRIELSHPYPASKLPAYSHCSPS